MVEASDALTKAVTSQQTEAQQCAKGMVEASDALTKAVISQHGEVQRCA